MESEYGPGCGVDDHDAHCLCDVIILEAVEMNFDKVLNSPIAQKIFDHVEPASMNALAFLETLTSVGDVMARAQSYDPPKAESAHLHAWLQGGNSIVDYPAQMGISFEETVQICTARNPAACWGWSEHEWLIVEDVLDNLTNEDPTNPSARRVSTAMLDRGIPMTDNRARSFMQYYWGISRGTPASTPRPTLPGRLAS